MIFSMNRTPGLVAAGLAAGCGLLLTASWSLGAGTPSCDADNGGLKLPAGFCALVAADDLGPARHLAVAPNGDLFVALQGAGEKGGVVGLHDTNGDGRFEMKEHFGDESTTGVGLRNGYIYLAHPTSIERY